ncbi:putative transmembrane protein [Rhodopirellula islandica]|uniref:Transmembrane protein n=1 Tax=Rhodopirellula islandica TaxID=595434 RepID=A0A0J1B452_RHOIS|nr:hypothetical protein [Rhodopirellula islandica]KLU01635.1 putative transmembrane protein [Rhodopirellula islandica]
MNDSLPEEDPVDGVLLGWCLVWSVVLSIVAASFGGLQDLEDLADENQLFLACSLGGLTASWAALGTWCSLIHVPAEGRSRRRTRRCQMGVGCFLLVDAIVIALAWLAMPSIATQLMLVAGLSCLGPFLIWQWFRRPIHRGKTPPTGQRNIRQILGMAFTIAVANVLFKIAGIWMDLSQGMITLVLSLAVGWTLLLLTLLSRQWAWIFGLIPIFIGQPFVVLLIVDMESGNADEQAMIVSGTFIGFYLFAMLYVLLLRSSGHKWFRSI